jgi:hypothetical protein
MLVLLRMQANTTSNKAMRVSPFRSTGEYRRKVLGEFVIKSDVNLYSIN